MPPYIKPGMRISFWPKTGFGALYLKRKESFFFLFSYFWCQTSPVSPGSGPNFTGWFSKSSTFMVRLTPKTWKQKRKLLKLSKIYSFNRLLKINLHLRYRAPDQFFFAKPDSYPCIKPTSISTSLWWMSSHWSSSLLSSSSSSSSARRFLFLK